jgi:hypothetical protein
MKGGHMTGDGRANTEFAKWMASWSAQIQQRNALIGHLRQKQTVENGKLKYPDEKPLKTRRPKAA